MAFGKETTKKVNDDPFGDEEWGGMGNDAAPEASGDAPEASVDETRHPFLKPYMLKADKGTLELVSMSTKATEYSDVILTIKSGTTLYRMGLKLFSPDYKALRLRFGAKTADWHGTLRYKIMPHGGKDRGFVAVR